MIQKIYFSKIFEKVILKNLYSYMTDNNVFSENQCGFRSNFSTELAALYFSSHLISRMDMGNINEVMGNIINNAEPPLSI